MMPADESNATHREVTLRDGRTLAFTEYGSPSGRPIVHCHGASDRNVPVAAAVPAL